MRYVGVELEACLKMSPLKGYVSQPPKTFIAREIMHKLRWYQILDCSQRNEANTKGNFFGHPE